MISQSEPIPRARYAEFIRAETNKWIKVVKEAGVKVED